MTGEHAQLERDIFMRAVDLPADELWRRIDARNSHPPWVSYPMSRTDLDGWIQRFDAPDAAELSLFDDPPAAS